MWRVFVDGGRGFWVGGFIDIGGFEFVVVWWWVVVWRGIFGG